MRLNGIESDFIEKKNESHGKKQNNRSKFCLLKQWLKMSRSTIQRQSNNSKKEQKGYYIDMNNKIN